MSSGIVTQSKFQQHYVIRCRSTENQKLRFNPEIKPEFWSRKPKTRGLIHQAKIWVNKQYVVYWVIKLLISGIGHEPRLILSTLSLPIN